MCFKDDIFNHIQGQIIVTKVHVFGCITIILHFLQNMTISQSIEELLSKYFTWMVYIYEYIEIASAKALGSTVCFGSSSFLIKIKQRDGALFDGALRYTHLDRDRSAEAITNTQTLLKL